MSERTRRAPVDSRPRRRSRDGEGAEHRSAGRRADRQILAFVTAAGLPLALALQDGGLDIVGRQEVYLGLWWVLALALAFGFVPAVRPARGVRVPLIALALLVAWTALSLGWTESDERTFQELAHVIGLAGVLTLAWYGAGQGHWIAAAAGISFAALAIPALAVLSRVAPDSYVLSPIASLFDPTTSESERLLYPLGYWNAVATWSAMAIAIGLSWSAHLRRPFLRAVCLAAVPVAALADYLAYSRGGTVGAAIAVLVVLAVGRHRVTIAVHAAVAAAATGIVVLVVRGEDAIAHGTGGEGGGVVAAVLLVACVGCGLVAYTTRRWRLDRVRELRQIRLAVAAIALCGAAVAIALGPGIASNATDRFASEEYPATSGDPAARLVSLEGSRDDLWSSALEAVASDPLKGTGPGTFEFWWARDDDNGDRELVRDAHSLYLEAAAELGLPGLTLVLVLLGGLLALAVAGRRAARRSVEIGATTGLIGAFAVYLVAAGIDWMWESPAVTVLALGGAAIAAAPLAASRSRRRSAPAAARFGVVALAIAAGALQVPGLVSTERVRASNFALAIGDDESAAELADDAVAAEPWAASAYAQRARVELSGAQHDAARSAALAAIEREPTNWRHRFLLALIELEAGEDEAAEAALAELKELRASSRGGVDARLEALREGR